MSFPRSLLFVPANRPAMFARAFESGADAVIFDLEDSVPADQKGTAREALVSLQVPAEWGSSRPVLVRVNAYGTAQFEADMRAAGAAPVSGIILPKVERGAQVQLANKVLELHKHHDRPLMLILLIETPGGVLRVAELADCGVRRLGALAFGAEDYRAGVGVDGLDPTLADFARAAVVNAAAAAGVPAIDAPELQIDDTDRLRSGTRRTRALGFKARFAIHPSQVPVINEELSGGEDRTWAARVVEAWERAAGEGRGAVALDGRMIDAATIKRARDLLQA